MKPQVVTIERDAEAPLRVLVVDDDSVQRLIIGKIAAQAGFEVTEASCFDQAAAFLATSRFQRIVLDLSLAEHDGVEILRLISDLDVRAPVILASGCDERILNSAARIARSFGIDVSAALRKPLDLACLRATFSNDRKQAVPVEPHVRPAPQLDVRTLVLALENGEISPAFQPKVDLRTGEVVGFEALARWTDRRGVRVPPDLFVPAMERFGLMSELTFHMLRMVARTYRPMFARHPRMNVAVNLCASMLEDLGLPERLEEILGQAGVPAGAITLEVTETVALANAQVAADILTRLRIKGFGVSIDDFGCGYSSLSALARIPFSELKIDQSFVRQGQSDPDMWKIVRAAIALAREFGIKVVAEGIENDEMRMRLAVAGCDIGQGYVFSRPLPIGEAEAWLTKSTPNPRRASAIDDASVAVG